MYKVLRIVSGLVVGLALSTSGAWAEDASPLQAVWQKHEYSFVFMGFTSTYSCDGLADSLKRILLKAGARSDAKTYPRGCGQGGRPERLASADVKFYTLAPAGEGKEGEPAVGAWKHVHFTQHDPREVNGEDCELVEQFTKTLLPMFTTRNVDSRTTCIPHQASGSYIELSFDVLAALPAGAAPTAAPAEAAAAAGRVYAYPKKGQGAEQQAKDRDECHASAVAAMHVDPDAPSAVAPADARAFRRAEAACLEARGYAVH